MYYEGLYMDAIDAAIEKGYHINDIPEFKTNKYTYFPAQALTKSSHVFVLNSGISFM